MCEAVGLNSHGVPLLHLQSSASANPIAPSGGAARRRIDRPRRGADSQALIGAVSAPRRWPPSCWRTRYRHRKKGANPYEPRPISQR